MFGLRKAIAVPHVPYFSGYPGTLRVPWDPQGNQEDPDTLTPESVTDLRSFIDARMSWETSRAEQGKWE